MDNLRLDPLKTFATIILGASNERATDLARRPTGRSRGRPTPLLVRGPSGSGKSHVLQAIANEIVRRCPETRMKLLTADDYMRSLVESMRGNTTQEFERGLGEDWDAVLVDDVDFLGNKDVTQSSLRVAIKTSVGAGRQVVLAAGPRAEDDIDDLLAGYRRSVIVRLRPQAMRQRLTALRRVVGGGRGVYRWAC